MPAHSDYRQSLDFRVDEVDAHEARGVMEIGPGMLNPFGTVHAGALIWFADVVATTLAFGGGPVAEGAADFPVAVTINAQMLANRREGRLTATARWVKRGRRVSTVRTLVEDTEGRVLMDLTTTHVSAK